MPGFYWNRDAFKGLSALADALRSDSRLERLARYCELRESGLRRQAFDELNAFLAEAKEWDEALRRSMVSRLVDLFDRYSRLAQAYRNRWHEAKARVYSAKAEEHYRAGGGDGPPCAAAMGMPRPRRLVITDARSDRSLRPPDDAA